MKAQTTVEVASAPLLRAPSRPMAGAGVMPALRIGASSAGARLARRAAARAISLQDVPDADAEHREIDDDEGHQRAPTAGARERRDRVARCAAGRRPCRAGGRPRSSPSRRSPRRSPPAPSPARSGAASASRRASPRSARHQAPQRRAANISKPSPTMIRNDQNTIATGGRSACGTVSSPAQRRVQVVLEDQRRQLAACATA